MDNEPHKRRLPVGADVLPQGGGRVGDFLDRVPTRHEQRVRRRKLDEFAVGENLFQFTAQGRVERLEAGRRSGDDQAPLLEMRADSGDLFRRALPAS